MKRLIVRADDAGSCVSANTAIREAVDAGTVKNVSVMACGPELEDAAARLAVARLAAVRLAGRKDVCFGLHVTLNAEWAGPKWEPVLPPERVPSLIDPATGMFLPTPRDLEARVFSVVEAIAEVEAQLRRARNAGFPITYLDEHMGVGRLPGLRNELIALCQRENLLATQTLPLTSLPGGLPWMPTILAAPDGDYLLVTHPGKIAPDMNPFFLAGETPGVVAAERDAERRALTDKTLHADLFQVGVQCLRYNELG